MPPSADRTLDAADDEGRLIDRSRQGDAGAFTQLVSAHQGRVRAYIGGTINRPEVVDDLAQEVFLSAFRSLETYKGEAPFGVWLLASHDTRPSCTCATRCGAWPASRARWIWCCRICASRCWRRTR